MTLISKTIGLLIISFISLSINAQSMEESLVKSYLQMDSAKTYSEMMSVSAQFDRIADKWNNQWVPLYYAAYAKAKTSYLVQDSKKKDLLLDEATKYLEKINLLKTQSEEVHVLAAIIIRARIAVDGQNRGREYSDEFNQQLEDAKKINPNNPRVYYLKGSSVFNSPVMFGGGKAKAKPYFEKAKELFSKEVKTSILQPYWGERLNLNYLKRCDEN